MKGGKRKISSVPSSAASSAASCTGDIREHQERYEATADSQDVYTITELVKPIGYQRSLFNDKDVTVTFLAKRSDGKETLVNNKFLKMNNPLLLINFYEQNLLFKSSV